MNTVLIVDDNADLRFNLSNLLKGEGFKTLASDNGEDALKLVKRETCHLVLLDIKLPGMDGMKILEEMKRIDRDLMIIMITAYVDIKNAIKAVKLGAFDYITKPFDSEELIFTIKKAIHTQCLGKEIEILKKRLSDKIRIEEIMGESEEIKKVLKQVELVAPTDMTVILHGESGTGKEVMASLLHQKSKRKDKPFIPIDCGTIPETLCESELFGYEKGAFTGADSRKIGRFEEANGGTLFLDEIYNLSNSLQTKLLRVLEERKLKPLGSNKVIKIDIRIIVAASHNLSDAVRLGKFRDDLFHRLNEFQINIPLLRERKDDIPTLAKYFLKEANQELKKNIEGFSTEAMTLLLNYSWPGNIRELKNVIKRAVLTTDSMYIEPQSLSLDIIYPEKGETNNLDEVAKFKGTVREVERDLLKKALEKSDNNKIKAAEMLGLNRKTFYRKLKTLGL